MSLSECNACDCGNQDLKLHHGKYCQLMKGRYYYIECNVCHKKTIAHFSINDYFGVLDSLTHWNNGDFTEEIEEIK